MSKRAAAAEIPVAKRSPGVLCFLHHAGVRMEDAIEVEVRTYVEPGAPIQQQQFICKTHSCYSCLGAIKQGDVINIDGELPAHEACCASSRDGAMVLCLCHNRVHSRCTRIEPDEVSGCIEDTVVLCTDARCSLCAGKFAADDYVVISGSGPRMIVAHQTCCRKCEVCERSVIKSWAHSMHVCDWCALRCSSCKTEIRRTDGCNPIAPSHVLCHKCASSDHRTVIECSGKHCLTSNHCMQWIQVTSCKPKSDTCTILACVDAACASCNEALEIACVEDRESKTFLCISCAIGDESSDSD